MEKLQLIFYEKTSWEDAYPCISNSVMVACDGCGGSGSSKHPINPNLVNTLEKVHHIVLPEDIEGRHLALVGSLFAPIIKEPTVVRTSAFWASRIVMARFTYFYSHVSHSYEEAKEFIQDGLVRIAIELDLHKTGSSLQDLLPTTFVSIETKEERDNEIDINVYWAGDSRACMLTNFGLRKLSIDDENEAGSITNYFSAETIDTRMNHRQYTINKPCVLFVCSDGIFDNFNNLLLEYILLGSMQEANSMEEYQEVLRDFYSRHKADDCTLALKAYGFNTYEEMKEYYKPRYEYVKKLYDDYLKYHHQLEIRNNPDRYIDDVERLTSRFKDRIDVVVDILNDAFSKNIDTDLLDDEYEDMLCKASLRAKKEEEEYIKEANKVTVNELKEALKKDVDIDAEKAFIVSKMDEEHLSILNKIADERNATKFIASKIKEYEQDIVHYQRAAKELIVTLNKINSLLLNVSNINASKKRRSMFLLERSILNRYCSRSDLENVLNGLSFFITNEFKNEMILYYVKANNASTNLPILYKKLAYRRKEVGSLVDYLFNDYDYILNVLNKEVDDPILSNIFSKITSDAINNSKRYKERIKEEIKSYLLKDDNVKKVILARLSQGEKESIIDTVFNSHILNETICYHKLQNDASSELNEFYIRYDELNHDVNLLIEAH